MRRIELGERPTSRRELAAWYSAALDTQRSSGLSMNKFAARVGVPVATLYQWRRRFESAEDEGEGRARLVEVTVAPSAPCVGPTGMVVRLGDGRRRIEVPRGFDGDDLRRLIAVLESC